ncbi:alpha/beta hydrolase [Croceicoccus sp. Ery5]|uniref:alpha/beta hydrolase n=1 Tax=Croceicoccus sp. Ery5 TaxID=1703340 RepID=UPI001E2D2FE4|nr:alpha/beta hydrolase [Croceicoccus sp. Ery5]
MAHYLELDTETLQHPPLILVLAGGRQRRRHFWRSLELTGIDYRTVDIDGGQKSPPPKSPPPKSGAQTSGARTTGGYTSDSLHRNTLVNRISLAVYRARRPVVLVAHGIGCVVAAWWAEYERPACGNPVLGAVLVEPPDVDRPGTDPVLARLGSCPRGAWPFPSFLVSDLRQEDALRRSHRMLAADWGSRLAEITRDPRMARMSAHGPAPEARLVARLLAERGIAPRAVVADSAPADMAPAGPMFGHAGRPRSLPQRIGDAVGQIVRW